MSLKTICQYVMVVVSRSMLRQIPNTYFAHEIPILQEVHGADRVRIVDFPLTADGKPAGRAVNPESEYQRVRNRFGADESGRYYVDIVYGPYQAGGFKDALRKRYTRADITVPTLRQDDIEEEVVGQVVALDAMDDSGDDSSSPEEAAALRTAIRDKLNAWGVKYNPDAQLTMLEDLLEEAAVERLKAGGIDVDDGLDMNELIELADSMTDETGRD